MVNGLSVLHPCGMTRYYFICAVALILTCSKGKDSRCSAIARSNSFEHVRCSFFVLQVCLLPQPFMQQYQIDS